MTARWGLQARWGRARGDVAVRDPETGEWWEIEGRCLGSDNPRTDLAWLRRRIPARPAGAPARGGTWGTGWSKGSGTPRPGGSRP